MIAPVTARQKFWLLDYISGWRAAQYSGIVEFGADGDLHLETLPGTAELFFDGGAAGFQCPVAAGKDECGVLYVLDAAKNMVARVNLKTGEAKPITEIGGAGHDSR